MGRLQHIDSHFRCLVAHYRDKMIQPPCIKCATCGRWVEHSKWDSECDGNTDWMYCKRCGGSVQSIKYSGDDVTNVCANCGQPWRTTQ